VSIDGPAFLHNAHRRTWGGAGSHDAALRGFRVLQERGVPAAALAVLTSEALNHPEDIFDFFLDNDIWCFGFNVEEVENAHGLTSLGSGNANPSRRLRDRCAAFDSRLFDVWWPVRDMIDLREFRDVLRSIGNKLRDAPYVRQPDESVELGIVTVQTNGDVTAYSPEFAGAVAPAFNNFVVGNVLELKSIDEIRLSPTFLELRGLVEAGRRRCAEACLYFDLCGSAFISNRYFETGRIDVAESTTCILRRQIVTQVVLEKLQRESGARSLRPLPLASASGWGAVDA
jgi:uncharacterized protein